MKENKIILTIGLVLLLGLVIQGVYIFDLRQQINNGKASSQDSLSPAYFHEDWFKKNEDDLFNLFTNFDNMQREMDQLFGRFSIDFRGKPYFDSVFGNYTSSPVLDFKEEDTYYLVEVELPGAEQQSVDVSVEGLTLTIKAEVSHKDDQHGSQYRRSERFMGKLERSLLLPADSDPGKMTTTMENGVLTIIIPKQA